MGTSTWKRLSMLVVVALFAASCGGAETIGRQDAIAALQTTGASEAEATCLADTLAILGELNAADPRVERGPAEREALVAANNRCLTGELDVEVAGTQVTESGDSDLAIVSSASRRSTEALEALEDEEELAGSSQPDSSEAELRDAAIETLVRLGRSVDNATCVVDHIIGIGESAVVQDSNFGLGLDPFEAGAFAACSATR